MSAPLPPPVPDWAAATPEWSPPAAWPPPAQPSSPPPVAGAGPARRPGLVVLALAALLGVVAGSVAATLLVTAAFVGSARDIGREMGAGLAAGVSEGMARSMEGSFSIDEEFGWGGGVPVAPEDVAEPVPPVPGPDPVLDAYAQGCFEGDYQACDDLFFESPPMSDYEEYGGTCGGRVKLMSVMACTDLD